MATRGPGIERLVARAVGAVVLGLLAASTPSRAEPLGDTSAALPGLERLMVPGASSPRVSAATSGSYGYTEALAGERGPHHRLAGTLAVGAAALPWLEAGIRLDGRYDRHPPDASGKDDGMVGEPRVDLRLGTRTGDFLYGLDTLVWLVGSAAPSIEADATTVELRGLGAFAPVDGRLTVALNGGFRLDQSARSVSEPSALRPGDRVGLGVSDAHALLLGLGVSRRFGAAEVLGEVTTEHRFGKGAPSSGGSPLRALLGARYWLGRQWALAAHVEALATGRPSLAPTAPLVPIEPRFTLQLGLRFRLGKAAEPAAPEPGPEPDPAPAPPAPEPDPITDAPEPVVLELTGRVVDEAAAPVPDARITLDLGGEVREQHTAADGTFRFEVPEAGEGTLAVESAGFDVAKRTVVVAGGTAKGLEITLLPAVPTGELKGLVRSLDGTPVRATIAVAGTEVRLAADASGAFSATIPPGSYVVEIEAEGFVGQSRRIRVENRGVTVLNVDLTKKR